MTTRDTAPDDIIELTEIVEDGLPLTTDFDDFPMDKAVDASSLDQELDALLRETEIPEQTVPGSAAGVDFDQLFTETQALAAQPSPDGAVDLSDFDEIFESLQESAPTAPSALDALLEADAASHDQNIMPLTDALDLPEIPEPAPSKPAPDVLELNDPLDLSATMPGLQETLDTSAPTADLLDLTDELLDAIPDTVLAPPAEQPRTDQQDAAQFDALDLDLGTELGADLIPQGEPVSTAPLQAEPSPVMAAQSDLLGALDDELDTPILTAAESPVPVADAPGVAASALDADLLDVRDDELDMPILATTEAPHRDDTAPTDLPVQTLAEVGKAPTESDISRAELDLVLRRLDALEARPEPTVTTEQILALLPETPDVATDLAALRQEMDVRLHDQDATTAMDALYQQLGAISARLDTVEARPEPDLSALEARLDALAPTADLDALRHNLEAGLAGVDASATLQTLQTQFDAVTTRLESVAARPEPDLAGLETRLETRLDALASAVDLSSLRQDMDSRLAALDSTASLDELRAQLEVLSARLGIQEARPEPTVTTEQVVAALPASPDGLPLAQALGTELSERLNADLAALRQEMDNRMAGLDASSAMDALRTEVLLDVDERLIAMASAAGLDSLQQTVGALQSQIDALPDMLAGYVSTADLTTELGALRAQIQTQAATIAHLSAALTDKDNRLAALQTELTTLHGELTTVRLQSGPEARREQEDSLRRIIEREVPGAAARIIREEIQNLLRDLQG